MTPVLLIARNYLRDQRWVVLTLVLYPVGMALLLRGFDARLNPGDLTAFLQQQASFAVLFSVVFASAAIHQERRSRRILGVLSKAVRRGQYVAGLLVGIWGAIGAYVLSAMLTLAWWSRSAAAEHGVGVMIPAYVAALAASAVTLFFSTFIPPFFATLAAGLYLGAPIVMRATGIEPPVILWPAFYLMVNVVTDGSEGVPFQLLGWTLVQAVLFWGLATIVFTRRDVAVAID